MHETQSLVSHSMAISGDITVDTSLLVEGAVSGNKIDAKNHTVVVGQYSAVTADIHARIILVIGQMTGNLHATERIDIRATAVINGDIHAPLIRLEEKGKVNGRLDYTAA